MRAGISLGGPRPRITKPVGSLNSWVQRLHDEARLWPDGRCHEGALGDLNTPEDYRQAVRRRREAWRTSEARQTLEHGIETGGATCG
jgi:hypothetical protein